MTTRYCPSCDLEGMPPYTIWVAVKHEDIGWYVQCVGDQYEDAGETDHSTYMQDGAYHVMCEGALRDNLLVGRVCEINSCDCLKIIASLVKAMEREAADGVLDPDMWAPTFSRRTSELVAEIRKKVAAALADKLPVVLVEIVSAYFV